jgi:transcriptional regulator with XRE-family HTH domain
MRALAEYLKRLREARDVSQTQVSEKAELSETYYGKIELGQRRPSPTVLYRICAALLCTAEETQHAMTLLAESLMTPAMLALLLATPKRPTRAAGGSAAASPFPSASPPPPSAVAAPPVGRKSRRPASRRARGFSRDSLSDIRCQFPWAA